MKMIFLIALVFPFTVLSQTGRKVIGPATMGQPSGANSSSTIRKMPHPMRSNQKPNIKKSKNKSEEQDPNAIQTQEESKNPKNIYPD